MIATMNINHQNTSHSTNMYNSHYTTTSLYNNLNYNHYINNENNIVHNFINNINYFKYKSNIADVTECGMIIINNNKMLIIYQNESQKWGFPKGKMTSDEINNKLYFNCAKRELHEETGILLNFYKYKKLNSVIIKNKLFFIVTMLSPIKLSYPIDSDEIGKMKWIDIQNVNDFIQDNDCNITMKCISKYINITSHNI